MAIHSDRLIAIECATRNANRNGSIRHLSQYVRRRSRSGGQGADMIGADDRQTCDNKSRIGRGAQSESLFLERPADSAFSTIEIVPPTRVNIAIRLTARQPAATLAICAIWGIRQRRFGRPPLTYR
uniref:Uncharacterized protein n=1 Tax=Plectus sambesii TaxID=2011161 RepID=A0A914UJZ9_9BILA